MSVGLLLTAAELSLHDGNTRSDEVLNDGRSRQEDTLDGVNHNDGSISDSYTGDNLVNEVDVTGGVDKVDQVGLATRGGEYEGHGSGFEGDETGLGERVSVGVSELWTRARQWGTDDSI